jgi:hypothetical protein
MEIFLFFCMFLEIIVLIFIAKSESRGNQILLWTLSGFWFISFILRPLIFIYSRNHSIGTSLFDFRLGQNPQNFEAIMISIIVGSLSFCVPLLVHLSRKVKRERIPLTQHSQIIYRQLITYCFICGYLSFLIEESSYRNPFSKSLTILISLGFLVYIWKREELKLTKTREYFFILSGCSGTLLLFASANNSKGIILTPALFYIMTLRTWNSSQKKFRNIFLGTLIFIFSIPLFSTLQSYKLGSLQLGSATSTNISFPWYLAPFRVIADRFDEFPRVVDAQFATPGSLGSFGSWGEYLIRNFEWNPTGGRTQLSFGQQWNVLVTNQTIPGAQLSHVSLAQGMIGEGIIWSGVRSLILECFIFAFIFMWIGNLLDRGPIANLFAFGMIGNSTIFESGLVQFVATFSGALKALLFLLVTKQFFFTRKVP